MIRTDRLLLRPFNHEDTADLFAIISAEGVLEYFPPSPPPTLETAGAMIDRVLADWGRIGYGLWAVDLEGELVGRAGLQLIPDTDETEVDFIIAPRRWGLGLATEAGHASLRYGFETLGVEEIVGIVHPDNAASRSVLHKLGMTHRSHARYFGMDVERYVVDASSWRRNSGSTLD